MLRVISRRFSGNKLEEMLSKGVHQLPREKQKIKNKEALKIYRSILKLTREFTWHDENNRLWAERIKSSARQEFELARYEKDPFLIGQMIITSKEAIEKVREKLIQKYYKVNQELVSGTLHSQNAPRRQPPFGKQPSQEKEITFNSIIEI